MRNKACAHERLNQNIDTVATRKTQNKSFCSKRNLKTLTKGAEQTQTWLRTHSTRYNDLPAEQSRLHRQTPTYPNKSCPDREHIDIYLYNVLPPLSCGKSFIIAVHPHTRFLSEDTKQNIVIINKATNDPAPATLLAIDKTS